jgi:hypothetical protein
MIELCPRTDEEVRGQQAITSGCEDCFRVKQLNETLSTAARSTDANLHQLPAHEHARELQPNQALCLSGEKRVTTGAALSAHERPREV